MRAVCPVDVGKLLDYESKQKRNDEELQRAQYRLKSSSRDAIDVQHAVTVDLIAAEKLN